METVFIYILKDPLTNDIRYVGKTVDPKVRLSSHIRKSKDRKYHSARWIQSLLKNGNKPIMEIIEESNLNNWEERETYWISYYREKYDLTNILDGGGHSATYGRLGKPWSEEQRINNKKSRLGLSVKHTKEGNEKRAEGVRRYCDRNKKPVLQYDLEGNFIGEWPSAVDAGKGLNTSYSPINRSCKKTTLTCCGYMWRYKDGDGEIITKIDKHVETENSSNVEVIQLTKEGKELKEYKSIMEASRQTGILNSSINNCLSKRSKSAGGYKWMYKNSINN